SCTTTGRRSTWCRATSWSGTTGRARAASSPSRRPTRAARPACTTALSLRATAASSTKFTITKPPGMLKTGNEHLESLRDGRVVYIGSERYSIYFLKPKTREDLARRSRGHRMIAELTYGMFGRSPDHVASFVTGMAMKPDELKPPHGNAGHLLSFYDEIRKADSYVVYAV